jgi:tRNA-splicing ligase RtcB (3'-phosphate/5'-hydroxy nucleic acid ligase)
MFSYHKVSDGRPLKLWDSHSPFEHQAMDQLRNVARLPFIYKHVAGMPDVHYGRGATVGSVIATKGAVIPAAVGVDIGCGMMAVKLNINADRLPDSLHKLRLDIEASVPVGFSDFGDDVPKLSENLWYSTLKKKYDDIQVKHPGVSTKKTPARQIGTLGGGNHFVELCLDENNDVWVMLHSGSRGVGNVIGSYFITKAKEEMERMFITLPDKDLSYLVEGSELFDDYCDAVEWAQSYAKFNRDIMMTNIMGVLVEYFPDVEFVDAAVNCHHNYISREYHFGENVMVTRKGAVRAGVGDKGIIPGSMGTGSFIVEGLGNSDSFCSCSHGAGRVMSRGKAKEMITVEDHAKAMVGIEARLDSGILDESPAAYKDINSVMDAQKDLVRILYRLRQVLNIKG